MDQPVYRSPESNNNAPPPEKPKKPRRKGGGFGRVFRGYLMIAGAAATIYVLARLVIWLLVEMGI